MSDSGTVSGKVIQHMIFRLPGMLSTVITCVCVLAVLPGCERRDWQAEQAARQAAAAGTATAAEPRSADEEGDAMALTGEQPTATSDTQSAGKSVSNNDRPVAETTANEAVRLQIMDSEEQNELPGSTALNKKTFLVLDTRWENIYPKQKVSKDKLEGKTDRTMGVGGLGAGGGSSEPDEYVDMDVAYKIPKLVDHIYALVDGRAVPLHPAMSKLPNGLEPTSAFGIGKQGETRDLQLAFLVPKNAENVALQVFDYNNGHLLIRLRGSLELAKNSPAGLGDALDRISTDVVELAANRLDFADNYNGKSADPGWRFAVVQLSGQSVSKGGLIGDILQFDPKKYIWLHADGGYVYYASAGSTDSKGNIRFTPEIYQQQEVAFLVPDSAEHLSMGLRINRDVVTLSLTEQAPSPMPDADTRHEDGDVMEVLLYGSRRDGDYLILDLGIQPIIKGQGLEVKAARQFLLQTPDGEIKLDAKATSTLPGRPPDPFVVPPGAAVRFELAYKTAAAPTSLRVRGFRAEGSLGL